MALRDASASARAEPPPLPPLAMLLLLPMLRGATSGAFQACEDADGRGTCAREDAADEGRMVLPEIDRPARGAAIPAEDGALSRRGARPGKTPKRSPAVPGRSGNAGRISVRLNTFQRELV
jgi:hypothetical protein